MRRLFLLAPVLLALLLPAAASASIAKLGSGSSVTCDTTPAAGSDLDDTSVSNAYIRDIVCTNAGLTTVYVGGSGVTTNGTPIPPGSSYKAQLGASVVPQCYAATSTTVSCVEAMGSSEFDVPASAVGSRVELLASGTSTATGTAYVQLATLTVPAWADSVMCYGVVESITVGAMTGWQLVGSNRSTLGTAIGSLGYVKAGSPGAGAGGGGFLFFGKLAPPPNTATASGTTVNALGVGYSFPMTRSINIGRELTGIPTAISIAFECYAYGG